MEQPGNRYSMKIGLAVIVGEELNLIDNFIEKNKLSEVFSEIKFLCDTSFDGTVEKLLKSESNGLGTVYERDLNFNFAEQRNHLNEKMESEYIMRLDIDEMMNEELINWIKNFNGNLDAYTIMRQEKIEGKIKSYTEIVFLYKNIPSIKWKNKLHEVITGVNSISLLKNNCLIIHDKNHERCERQNKYYYNNYIEQRKIIDKETK